MTTRRSLLIAAAGASCIIGCSYRSGLATLSETTEPEIHARAETYRRGDYVLQRVYSRARLVQVSFGSATAALSAEVDPLFWSAGRGSTTNVQPKSTSSLQYAALRDLGCLYGRATVVADVFSAGGEWRTLKGADHRCLFRLAIVPPSGVFEIVERTDIPHEVILSIP